VYLYATGYLTLKIASRRSFLDENNQPFGSVSTAYQNTKIITNNLHLSKENSVCNPRSV
jgi:hypothetical protein